MKNNEPTFSSPAQPKVAIIRTSLARERDGVGAARTTFRGTQRGVVSSAGSIDNIVLGEFGRNLARGIYLTVITV